MFCRFGFVYKNDDIFFTKFQEFSGSPEEDFNIPGVFKEFRSSICKYHVKISNWPSLGHQDKCRLYPQLSHKANMSLCTPVKKLNKPEYIYLLFKSFTSKLKMYALNFGMFLLTMMKFTYYINCVMSRGTTKT